MVYIENTLKLCHPLTEQGKKAYAQLLVDEADRLILESQHKVLACIVKVLDKLGITVKFIQNIYDRALKDIKDKR